MSWGSPGMSEDQRLILDLLLDRFERSKRYRGEESGRAIFAKFDRETLPDYWDERRGERREELNQAATALERLGVLSLQRSRYSRAEIERADLVLEQVDRAYELAGRPPRRAQELQLAEVANEWASRWPNDWRRSFALSVAEAVATFSRLPAGFKPNEASLLRELCQLLDTIGSNGLAEELPRRILSQRVLGNSKRLEMIQGRLYKVLRESFPVPLPDDEREAFGELGIVENPQYVYVAGPVVLDGLDVGATGGELGLPAAFVQRSEVRSVEADWVLTVENLTSFYQVVKALPPRTVVLYLGGYHNRLRRTFLLKLAAARPALRYRHWGDIDLGGFRIFAHLRERTGLLLEPWLMDEAVYLEYESGGMTFADGYGRELEALLMQEPFAPFWPVIRAMLVKGRRVEQEAVFFHWAD